MKEIDMKIPMKTPRSHQQGIVILEALISILLFSIGILAIIALQANSIKETADAKYRTDASLLANQVIGKMWVADKANLAANFNSPNGSNYADWKNSVAALPGVSGVAANAPTITVGAGRAVTVTVFWQSPNEAMAHKHTATAIIND